ncbi:MAG: hypothetical protein HY934_00260 [Candidatus Firestonebacteria bacterium]|nr:hypothetical protein [Candidatus Firestonebacteria bacterium]
MHYMNPFDFVEFVKEINRKTINEWNGLNGNKLFSGRIYLTLKTITPLNISGEIKINPDAKSISEKKFYKQKYSNSLLPCIPANSIKGMLRSYIEALTNGFVSSYNLEYKKEKTKRNIGFKAEEVIYRQFQLPKVFDYYSTPVDISSFLFGLTALPSEDKKKFVGALKAKIEFSDVFFNNDEIKIYTALDLPDEKVPFGVPKPQKNNWWYFMPEKITKNNMGNAEFIGSKYRGRKFYFHQDPKQCIKYYYEEWKHQKLIKYNAECIDSDKASIPFYINFNKVPESLLKLLLTALCPGRTVRHKLGSLKPFGFGSVEFNIEKILFQKNGWDRFESIKVTEATVLEEDQELKKLIEKFKERKEPNREISVIEDELIKEGLINENTWKALRFILHCPENLKEDNRKFIYPIFRKKENGEILTAKQKGFAQTVRYENEYSSKISMKDLREIVVELFEDVTNGKQTIDFDFYQTKADNFTYIKRNAGLL